MIAKKAKRPPVTYGIRHKDTADGTEYHVLHGNRILARWEDEKIADAHLRWKMSGAKMPPAELVGMVFVATLRDWIKDPRLMDGAYEGLNAEQAWAKMCKDNARLRAEGSTCCASHDWCDANMAMDAAFRELGINPLPPGDDGMPDEIADLWNASWASAHPALSGKEEKCS